MVLHAGVPECELATAALAPDYIVPPRDRYEEYDFLARNPIGIVAEIVRPVAAAGDFHLPKWAEGVRVIAETNSVDATLTRGARLVVASSSESKKAFADGHVIVRQDIGSFDDSFQPTGRTKWPFHIEMKKLRHHYWVVVEGPDAARAEDCLKRAIGAGLIAGIAAALITGGAALSAAIAAFLAELEACLGNSYTVRVDHESHWEYRWT
jgi:hypothetical protein